MLVAFLSRIETALIMSDHLRETERIAACRGSSATRTRSTASAQGGSSDVHGRDEQLPGTGPGRRERAGAPGPVRRQRLVLEEVHRFPNGPVRMLDTLHWDLPRLFDEIKTAIRKGARHCRRSRRRRRRYLGGRFRIDRAGRHPACQPGPLSRCAGRTECWTRRSSGSRERMYEITGSAIPAVQYGVSAARAEARARSPLLEAAETLLLMPDLFGWLLTGRRAASAPMPRRRSCSTRAAGTGPTRCAAGWICPRDSPRADRAWQRSGAAARLGCG